VSSHTRQRQYEHAEPQVSKAKRSHTFKDKQLEDLFKRYSKKKDSSESLAEIVLGDARYEQRMKMPKWNGPVSMLMNPDVAVRHYHTLGVPTSKEAHRQRMEHFQALRDKFQAERERSIDIAEKAYGQHGALVSGAHRDHYPESVKNRLRFLAHSWSTLGDAVELHKKLWKTRSPSFS
jgi:hypothetical protein